MSREIRFRAWDNNLKTMIQVPLLSFGFDGSGKTLIVDIMDRAGFHRGLVVGESCELMQFTGLHDKNGKEIYEGDIIVIPGEYPFFDKDKPNYIGTVEWIYSQWQYVLHCVNPDKRGISDGINNGLNDDGVEDGKKTIFEVIGNIYENPELVKG